jgi:hypothetical protein
MYSHHHPSSSQSGHYDNYYSSQHSYGDNSPSSSRPNAANNGARPHTPSSHYPPQSNTSQVAYPPPYPSGSSHYEGGPSHASSGQWSSSSWSHYNPPSYSSAPPPAPPSDPPYSPPNRTRDTPSHPSRNYSEGLVSDKVESNNTESESHSRSRFNDNYTPPQTLDIDFRKMTEIYQSLIDRAKSLAASPYPTDSSSTTAEILILDRMLQSANEASRMFNATPRAPLRSPRKASPPPLTENAVKLPSPERGAKEPTPKSHVPILTSNAPSEPLAKASVPDIKRPVGNFFQLYR